MKKVLVFMLILVLGFGGNLLAQPRPRTNASPAWVYVSSSVASAAVTFPYPTRDLFIENMDDDSYVYINLTTDTDTIGDKSSGYLLEPGENLKLYDYITDGIVVMWDDAEFSGGTEASPISVLAIY